MSVHRLTPRSRAVPVIAGIAAIAMATLISAAGVPAAHAKSQSQNVAPTKYEYDVVSIKIIPPDDDSIVPGVGFSPNGFTANRVRLWWLFRMAYDLHRSQIVGAPSWVDDT